MSRLELSTPELSGSSTFLNTTRRSSEPGGKIQVTVSDCLAAWGFPTALTSLPAVPAVTATLMVAIGLPLSLKITPEMGRLLIIERRTELKPVNATGRAQKGAGAAKRLAPRAGGPLPGSSALEAAPVPDQGVLRRRRRVRGQGRQGDRNDPARSLRGVPLREEVDAAAASKRLPLIPAQPASLLRPRRRERMTCSRSSSGSCRGKGTFCRSNTTKGWNPGKNRKPCLASGLL